MPKQNQTHEELISSVSIESYDWMKSRTIICTLDDKGGVGKSMISQVVIMLFKYFDSSIAVADTDTNNSTSAQVTEGAHMLDLRENSSKGKLTNILLQMAKGEIDHVVIDVGAREEKPIKDLLPWLAQAARKLGGTLVVLRPLTLSSHNQRNAANFMPIAEKLGIPVAFVRNEGQGRRPEYFDRWIHTRTHADAMALGAVETVLTDADVRYADEAIGFGLSIADCALRDWSKLMPRDDMTEEERHAAEEDVADAEQFFSDDVSAWLGEWLRINMCNLGDAIGEAIARRAELDGNPRDAEETGTRSKPKKAK